MEVWSTTVKWYRSLLSSQRQQSGLTCRSVRLERSNWDGNLSVIYRGTAENYILLRTLTDLIIREPFFGDEFSYANFRNLVFAPESKQDTVDELAIQYTFKPDKSNNHKKTHCQADANFQLSPRLSPAPFARHPRDKKSSKGGQMPETKAHEDGNISGCSEKLR